MAVTMPRQPWTDERLDHFEKRVDERFDHFERRTDERFDNFEKRTDERFDRVDERFDAFEKRVDEKFKEVDARFEQVEKRLDRMDDDIRELRQTVAQLSEGLNQMGANMNRNFIALAMLIVAAVVFF